MKILPRKFYSQETTLVARKLLGKCLIRKIDGNVLSGIITETEEYRSDDPASHTYNGITERNKPCLAKLAELTSTPHTEFIIV